MSKLKIVGIVIVVIIVAFFLIKFLYALYILQEYNKDYFKGTWEVTSSSSSLFDKGDRLTFSKKGILTSSSFSTIYEYKETNSKLYLINTNTDEEYTFNFTYYEITDDKKASILLTRSGESFTIEKNI